MAYTNAQVAQAIAESVAQGFSVEQSIQGATQNYGIPPAQANAAAAMYLSGGTSSAGSPTPSSTKQTYSTEQIAKAMAESVAQGFTVDQTILGATQNFGIPRAQAIQGAAQYLSQAQKGSNVSANTIAGQLNSGLTAQEIQAQLNQPKPSQKFNQTVNDFIDSLTVKTPLTGQYYSESGLQPSFTDPSARTLQPLINPATISSAVDKFLATQIPTTAPTTAPIAPVATTPSTTFRSGVAGYIPQSALPTGFQFGTPLVNAAPQTYQPGAFQPADVTTGGFITGFNANQQPIYSTYNDPNVNVGGVLSTMNPFVNQGAQFKQLMADYATRQAADLARINSAAGE